MGPNGTGGVIAFGNLTPETIPVSIRRPNPRKVLETDPDEVGVMLACYVNGNRCPVDVAARFSAARNAWIESITARDDEGNPVLDAKGNPRTVDSPEMWGVFLAQALHIAVDGLELVEASVMANDEANARALLQAAKWLRRAPAPELQEDDAGPEAEGGEPRSTGPASSPASASTTPAPTGEAS